jgi:hypothetical protein
MESSEGVLDGIRIADIKEQFGVSFERKSIPELLYRYTLLLG